MQRFRVVPALRERLGDQGTEALTDMVHVVAREWRDDVLESVSSRFEQRLTQEVSALRVEVTKELSGMRADIIRWSFVFWITPLGAMAGLLSLLK
jgi:hypothetical protein